MKRREFLAATAATGTVLATGLVGKALAAEPLKIGFIYLGVPGDGGWTYQHDLARLAMEKHFEGKVVTSVIQNVPEGADAERSITQLALAGNKLIFTTSFGYMDPTVNVAKKFPKVMFEHATGYKRADNLSTYDARFYEGRAVIGTIAGRMTKTNKIGYIATFPIPEVVQGINSAYIHAKKVNPNVEMKVVAVKAMARPKTMPMPLRMAEPPSAKANPSPVTTMAMAKLRANRLTNTPCPSGCVTIAPSAVRSRSRPRNKYSGVTPRLARRKICQIAGSPHCGSSAGSAMDSGADGSARAVRSSRARIPARSKFSRATNPPMRWSSKAACSSSATAANTTSSGKPAPSHCRSSTALRGKVAASSGSRIAVAKLSPSGSNSANPTSNSAGRLSSRPSRASGRDRISGRPRRQSGVPGRRHAAPRIRCR